MLQLTTGMFSRLAGQQKASARQDEPIPCTVQKKPPETTPVAQQIFFWLASHSVGLWRAPNLEGAAIAVAARAMTERAEYFILVVLVSHVVIAGTLTDTVL